MITNLSASLLACLFPPSCPVPCSHSAHHMTHWPVSNHLGTIDLLPGTSAPHGHLCSLSPSESRKIEKYIGEAQAAGIICPFSSPGRAGFFFEGKKNKSFCSWIDYRGLNEITIKNRYLLLLIYSTFEPFQGFTIFTILCLHFSSGQN